MTEENKSHDVLRSEAIKDCMHRISVFPEQVNELVESIFDDINFARFKVPLPELTVFLSAGKIQIDWLGEHGNSLVITMSVHDPKKISIVAKLTKPVKHHDDEIYTHKIEGELSAFSYMSTMKQGKKVDPYEKWFFSIPDDFIELIAEKEELPDHITPILKTGVYNIDDNQKVIMGWTTDYYDGPLAGYCYIGNRLHYFYNVYETDYGMNRYFKVIKLNLIDKLCAYGRRSGINFRLSVPPLAGITRFWWNIKQKRKSELYYSDKEAWRKQIQEEVNRHKRWCDAHECVGYFQW